MSFVGELWAEYDKWTVNLIDAHDKEVLNDGKYNKRSEKLSTNSKFRDLDCVNYVPFAVASTETLHHCTPVYQWALSNKIDLRRPDNIYESTTLYLLQSMGHLLSRN